jgi:hypothetical protein
VYTYWLGRTSNRSVQNFTHSLESCHGIDGSFQEKNLWDDWRGYTVHQWSNQGFVQGGPQCFFFTLKNDAGILYECWRHGAWHLP